MMEYCANAQTWASRTCRGVGVLGCFPGVPRAGLILQGVLGLCWLVLRGPVAEAGAHGQGE